MQSSIGQVEVNEEVKNLFKESWITKLQEFYWLSFSDLFDEEKLKEKWVKEEDMKYILTNRDVEFARKETEAWEMKANLFKDPKWLKLKAFYGIDEFDIRDTKKLKAKWLKDWDINFITGKKPEEVKKEEVKEVLQPKEVKKWPQKKK